MNARSLLLRLIGAIAAVAPAAVAQQAAAPTPAPAPADNAAPAPAGDQGAAPAGSAAAPPPAPKNIVGYGYGFSNPKVNASAPSKPHGRMPHHANEAIATLPGFEMLSDGGSRLFVQLSKTVDYTQAQGAAPAPRAARKSKRARAAKQADALATTTTTSEIVVTLKGAEITRRNNENSLVTVHFNTPVVKARLVPAGRDLRFVIDLRADAAPNVKVVPTKDNGAMLQIDFPAGNYLPAGAANAPPPEPEGSGDATPPPAAPAGGDAQEKP